MARFANGSGARPGLAQRMLTGLCWLPVTLVLVAFVAWASRPVTWRQLLVRNGTNGQGRDGLRSRIG